MNEKQPLRAVFLYMCEAERCRRRSDDREPGSWNFLRDGAKNIPDHMIFIVLVSGQTTDYKRDRDGERLNAEGGKNQCGTTSGA